MIYAILYIVGIPVVAYLVTAMILDNGTVQDLDSRVQMVLFPLIWPLFLLYFIPIILAIKRHTRKENPHGTENHH